MNGEVERHHLIRDSLELEIQALRQRLSTVQNFSDIVDSENIKAGHTEDQMSRSKVLLAFFLVVFGCCYCCFCFD